MCVCCALWSCKMSILNAFIFHYPQCSTHWKLLYFFQIKITSIYVKCEAILTSNLIFFSWCRLSIFIVAINGVYVCFLPPLNAHAKQTSTMVRSIWTASPIKITHPIERFFFSYEKWKHFYFSWLILVYEGNFHGIAFCIESPPLAQYWFPFIWFAKFHSKLLEEVISWRKFIFHFFLVILFFNQF